MKILLSDISDEGLDLDVGETIESGSLRLLSPVRAVLRIDRVGSEVLVKGTITANIELQCSRCLRKFPKDAVVSVDVVYHPVEELKGEDRYEVGKDELNMGFYSGDELDIQELMLEQILLSVPMKPLCSESCKGICPKCGTDLNIKTCSCEIREMDPRLAVLKRIFGDRKE
ncbi:MAG: DUF177 domain-containing protein [Thermodesulfovibrionales bacterium]